VAFRALEGAVFARGHVGPTLNVSLTSGCA
jgi:hypothetical protein